MAGSQPPEPSAGVEQRDLQGNVLCGYGNAYAHGLFAFVHVHDGLACREWLGELVEGVTNAAPWSPRSEPDSTLNIAFGFDGLSAAGVSGSRLESFPEEFRAGMEPRAELLGDTGPNRPDQWDPGLRAGDAQVLVTVTAKSAETLEERRHELQVQIARSRGGLSLVHELPAALLDHPGNDQFGREHFGFADGLAQPSITGERIGPYKRPGKGVPEKEGGWRDLPPGEFVLGYTDDDGVIPPAPAEPFDRNCSFMVVRKLHQDVASFTACLRREAGDDPEAQELLAAKVVGRWRDGTPLVTSPAAPELAPLPKRERAQLINDFRYQEDGDGLRCPLGAHIRRANPRDCLGWEDRRSRRHRIIRRGMPYGPRPADPAIPDGVERGLMFVCYQASIERQFEVIQSAWLNNGDAFGLGDETDFLLSGEDPSGRMTIQGSPPRFLSPQPAFVTLKGGGYFFTPGIAALRAIAYGLS